MAQRVFNIRQIDFVHRVCVGVHSSVALEIELLRKAVESS